MRISLCTKILLFVTTITAVFAQHSPAPPGPHTPRDIDAAWIKVRWRKGGHYYHNMLTREDRDVLPDHLYQCTENLISETCN